MIGNILKTDFNKRIAKNSTWSLIGAVMPKIAILITSIFLARILGVGSFGELSIVRSTINMFTAFATAGIGLTATKFISQFINDRNKIAQYISLSNFVSTILGGFLFCVVFFFSDFIAEKTIKMPYLSNEIKLGAFMLLFNSLNSSQIGILTGFQNFKAIAINSILSIMITLPLQLYGAYEFGVLGALIGFATSFILFYLFNFISIGKELKKRDVNKIKTGYKAVISTLWKFTLPSALSSLMVAPILWFTIIILARGVNGEYEIGIYEAANQIKILIVFIPMALSQILLPVLVEKMNDKKEYKSIVNKNIILNIVVSTLIALIIILLAPSIMGLYGKSFSVNGEVLVVLSMSTILMAANAVIGQAIASKGKMWIGFVFNMIWGIILIMSSHFLVLEMEMGALGLSYSFLISYFILTLMQFIYYKYDV